MRFTVKNLIELGKNKISILFSLFIFFSIFTVFADDLDTARQYVNNNFSITNYQILDLELNKNGSITYLFYKPYEKRIYENYEDNISFTDAIIIKVRNNEVIQFLEVNKNGLIKTNDHVIFYNFSEPGYSHIEFNGWLLKTGSLKFDNQIVNTIALQLTNDGKSIIAADPSLPSILWDYEYEYPVKYKYTTLIIPIRTWLLEYEWREDLKISLARTGLRDMNMYLYLDALNSNEKRIVINTMFALHGYEFKTDEWENYFQKFLWYKPDSNVQNSTNILDEYQKKLFEYLSN